MILLDPRFWLALFVALGGAYATGRWQQYRSDEKDRTAEVLKATEKARQTEANWQSDAAVNEEVQRNEADRLNSEHLSQLARVRDYYKRLPPAASASGASTCPTVVPESTATAAATFERDAESLRNDYAACFGYLQVIGAKPMPSR